MMKLLVVTILVLAVMSVCIGSASAADEVDKAKAGAEDLGGKIADGAKDLKKDTEDAAKKASSSIADKYDDLKDKVSSR